MSRRAAVMRSRTPPSSTNSRSRCLYHLVNGAVAVFWQEALAECLGELHQHIALAVEVQLGIYRCFPHDARCAVIISLQVDILWIRHNLIIVLFLQTSVLEEESREALQGDGILDLLQVLIPIDLYSNHKISLLLLLNKPTLVLI